MPLPAIFFVAAGFSLRPPGRDAGAAGESYQGRRPGASTGGTVGGKKVAGEGMKGYLLRQTSGTVEGAEVQANNC